MVEYEGGEEERSMGWPPPSLFHLSEEDPRIGKMALTDLALDIRDTAFRKGRELVRTEFLSEKREQYKRWQEDMDDDADE